MDHKRRKKKMRAGEIPSTQVTEQVSYTVSENTVYSITPCEKMSIEVSVDELDISGLSVGQNVTVTLDALPGQSLEGTISKINTEGTYDSGNTKYAVTVTVDRNDEMLTGMNAGIRIDKGEPVDCLTVPASALVDKGGKTYVYTSYNEKDDTLGGLKEIETGLSDGTEVEITSGLAEGDKIYYRYADSIEYTFSRR